MKFETVILYTYRNCFWSDSDCLLQIYRKLIQIYLLKRKEKHCFYQCNILIKDLHFIMFTETCIITCNLIIKKN